MFEDYIYWADWDFKSIERAHKLTGAKRENLTYAPDRPMAIQVDGPFCWCVFLFYFALMTFICPLIYISYLFIQFIINFLVINLFVIEYANWLNMKIDWLRKLIDYANWLNMQIDWM